MGNRCLWFSYNFEPLFFQFFFETSACFCFFTAELLYIYTSGESAPILRLQKKCPQNHGRADARLTPSTPRSWYTALFRFNIEPATKPPALLVLHKYILKIQNCTINCFFLAFDFCTLACLFEEVHAISTMIWNTKRNRWRSLQVRWKQYSLKNFWTLYATTLLFDF